MASKKMSGTARGNRDSHPRYLGVKVSNGEYANAGNIIVTQKGSEKKPGRNTYMSKNFTIHARIDGNVRYKEIKGRTYIFVDSKK